MTAPTMAKAGSAGLTFYVGMAIAFAVSALIGFGPTYYLKAAFGAPPLTPLVHLHGAVFTAWLAILIAQPWLVASGRTDLHRRLGNRRGGARLPGHSW